MAQISIRERRERYSVMEEVVFNINEAVDYLRDAYDMIRAGYGKYTSKNFKGKSWYAVARMMEDIIRTENPDEAPFIINDLQCGTY